MQIKELYVHVRLGSCVTVGFLLSTYLQPYFYSLCLPPPHPLKKPGFSFPPPSTIDSFDYGRWWQAFVCHEIIVSSLALWWVLHSRQPPPPAYLFINVMCHLLHTPEPGRLNNCRAIPHRSVRVGVGQVWGREQCFQVKMLHSEYICGISGMEELSSKEWEWGPPLAHLVILVMKAWNGFIALLIWGLCCID